ncbi:hypothetical protein FJT64_026434 [Amphibalanus amphitrite]|uniref:Uncharacterized protein n=1 Tax=Amphibalanus amphitrite TaxID=1232801 RepID=A0A6A4WGR5_AMPAM|nr:hypothetical protein FJT64_026434 [Amphibalanus amphitrite]
MRLPTGVVGLLTLWLLALPLVLAGISSCPPLRPDAAEQRRCLQLTQARSTSLGERLVAAERQRAGRGRRESHCLSDSGSPELRLRAVCPFQVRSATFGDVDPVQLQVAHCLCTNDSCGPGQECTPLKTRVDYKLDGRDVVDMVTVACVCAAPLKSRLPAVRGASLWERERPFVETGAGRRRRRRLAHARRRWQRLWPRVEAVMERMAPETL